VLLLVVLGARFAALIVIARSPFLLGSIAAERAFSTTIGVKNDTIDFIDDPGDRLTLF
jgi:hypothetical protein